VAPNDRQLWFLVADELRPICDECRQEWVRSHERIRRASDMVSGTRPGVFVGVLDEACAYRITLDIPDHGQQMGIVLDRKRVKAFLGEVAPDASPNIHRAGVASMCFAHRAGQGARSRGHQDQVHVIGHQTPGPDLDAVLCSELGEELQIPVAIPVGGEDRHRADAPLEHVVREAR
jgi:hypothetical protein